ncbi:30S ribosomal protein S20 [Nonlabens ponticola]|uniref:Small ribosomal subunit protein bS20 n=1 Tax=Nonlabens ponticola TaxID=2496866 RepID=A0A3S9MXC6_9FLAO|nr:30S ribosomal protein S20 [Nonlabens ponticola]AZQ43713.1 30S ribosomal protein S20 [Nonlabens ponticola]
MANHKSALKRIRRNEAARVRNKYQHKTTRNAIKKLKETEDKSAAEKLFVEVTSMIDKLAKKNIIHDNKAGNLKSQLAKHINAL